MRYVAYGFIPNEIDTIRGLQNRDGIYSAKKTENLFNCPKSLNSVADNKCTYPTGSVAALEFQTFQRLFILFGAGMAISMCIFLIELIFNNKRKGV